MEVKEISKKILDKKFESVINGYSPSSVDNFLDNIIADLKNIDFELTSVTTDRDILIDENKKLKDKIKQLEQELNNKNIEIQSLEKNNNTQLPESIEEFKNE